MKCGCAISIFEGTPGSSFAGYAVIYPRPKSPGEGTTSVWVELKCTREDDHPVNGSEHWWESDGRRMSWRIAEDAVWIAGSAPSRMPG